MTVSILIATYQRPELLNRAMKSVLKQTYVNWDLTVINDDPDTSIVTRADARIKVINNRYNQGKEHGDIAHLRRFLKHHCEGDAFVYLCDDDYWIPDDLLERQVALLGHNAFVLGGMAQQFPDRKVFEPGLFPEPLMLGGEYIELLAQDPANRNIVSGACLFKTETFKRAGALERARGVKWQAGYALTVAPALSGNVVYLDEPCVMSAVDPSSASYRGTQMGHMLDALNSVEAGFGRSESPLQNKMKESIILIYVCNKLGDKLGYGFAVEMDLGTPITGNEFLEVADRFKVTLRPEVKLLIRSSDVDVTRHDWPALMAKCKKCG